MNQSPHQSLNPSPDPSPDQSSKPIPGEELLIEKLVLGQDVLRIARERFGWSVVRLMQWFEHPRVQELIEGMRRLEATRFDFCLARVRGPVAMQLAELAVDEAATPETRRKAAEDVMRMDRAHKRQARAAAASASEPAKTQAPPEMSNTPEVSKPPEVSAPAKAREVSQTSNVPEAAATRDTPDIADTPEVATPPASRAAVEPPTAEVAAPPAAEPAHGFNADSVAREAQSIDGAVDRVAAMRRVEAARAAGRGGPAVPHSRAQRLWQTVPGSSDEDADPTGHAGVIARPRNDHGRHARPPHGGREGAARRRGFADRRAASVAELRAGRRGLFACAPPSPSPRPPPRFSAG